MREIIGQMRRTLKRLDLTARSLVAIIEPGSAFAGSLFELALAADRSYMLDDPERANVVALSPMNGGPPAHVERPLAAGNPPARRARRGGVAAGGESPFDPMAALDAGLVTAAPDELDWDDEVRLAIEARTAFSPDALTGMEANLRFAGPETLETKIFGRLSAWQNWIFQRPNAVGERGALKAFGRCEGPARVRLEPDVTTNYSYQLPTIATTNESNYQLQLTILFVGYCRCLASRVRAAHQTAPPAVLRCVAVPSHSCRQRERRCLRPPVWRLMSFGSACSS